MSKIKDLVKIRIKSLNSDQLSLYKDMQSNDLLQVCIPTGAGKGYLMMVDLLNQVVNTKNKIFAISSHRLMLNTQHMNDVFEILSPLIGKIGFVFVGSSKYDVDKFQDNIEFNKSLLKKHLSYNEIVGSTTNKKEVDKLVEGHIEAGRKVVILSTYHSLHTLANVDIDTIYNDEAHTLASDGDTKFQDNFEQVSYERCFFLTATPKDCVEDTETFLMNNFEVFGERVGLTFKHCVEMGYIVKPVIHIAIPSNLNYEKEFKSIKNMAKFVKETFLAHKEFIAEKSFDPSKIAPKLLIKCPGVTEMWEIHAELIGSIEGVKICAGASRNDIGSFNHYIDNEGVPDRSDYLEILQKFDEGQMVIALHYDTMSEGINIQGFTGTEFLGGKLPTTTKTLQNTGRSTRLHKFDRDRLITKEISTSDYSNWVKPYCAVIIPYWDKESEFTKQELARQIKSLRDDFGYNPAFRVSIGSDMAKGETPEDMDALNQKNQKNKKFELIGEIRHEIELMDQAEIDLVEDERINNMSVEEWFNYANGLN